MALLASNFKRQPDFDVRRAERDILADLSRHGIDAEVGDLVMGSAIDTGEVLLSYSADFGADPMISPSIRSDGTLLTARIRV